MNNNNQNPRIKLERFKKTNVEKKKGTRSTRAAALW